MAGEVQTLGHTNLVKHSLCFPVTSQPNKINCNLHTPPIGGDTTLSLGYKLNSVLRGFKQSSLLMSLPLSFFLNIDFIIIHKVK